ncbi:hypothetical protein P8452_28430 [Trifolium repens]|nr:hypothetical protein P8452_28430 [Trifolium repens]
MIIDKIVEGCLRKYIEDFVVMDQKFVMDDTMKVKNIERAIVDSVTLEKARDTVFYLNDSTDYARDAVSFSLFCSNSYRLETNPDQLAAVAYSIIQKEIARDGRELGYQSNGMHNKSISKKRSNAGSATNTKEKTALSQFCVVLTARASLGLIDPVICPEVEVQ